MARVTVEDCIDKVESPYELVLVAKERAVQLDSGLEPTLNRDDDKNTVISLREIALETIKVPDLTESAVYKLRKHVAQIEDGSGDDEIIGDDFESLYKGEISKSGIAILPSKRARKIPEKIQVSEEDLKELTDSAKPDLDVNLKFEESAEDAEGAESVEDTEVSLNEISEKESQATEANSEDTDTSNN